MVAHSTSDDNINSLQRWSGRALSALAVLFFIMDGAMKVAHAAPSVQATVAQLGYPEAAVSVIGFALLVFTVLYVIPRTSLYGAILLTAYLGGAVASNFRAGTPLFNTVFPIIFALFVWTGLALRNQRLKDLLLS